MFTRNDLIDVIMKQLSLRCNSDSLLDSKPKRYGFSICEEKKKSAAKVFISDWELRRMLKPGEKIIKVPGNAIISPLSRDWLDFNGIKIVYEK